MLLSRRGFSCLLLSVLPVVTLAAPASAQEVTLFAAASLKTAMDQIEPLFEAETGADLKVSLAGSSALARQIQQGAPADVFISANTGWMDELETGGEIDPASRKDLLGNAIVLVAHDPEAAAVEITPELDLPALLNGQPLAMALVDSVPAGIYGKTSLTNLGLWEGVEPSVAQADNVRAALSLVALGASPLGIVYATDAAAEPRVKVIGTFPEDSHDPIHYPIAAIAKSENPLTPALLAFLEGPEARAIFEGQGFTWLAE